MSNSSHMANPNASAKFAHGVTNFCSGRTTLHAQSGGVGSVLGARLKTWRKSKGLTLEALAEAIGTSKGHLSDMERNNKPLSSRWLEKIASTYGVSESEILGSAIPVAVQADGPDPLREVLEQFETLTPEAQSDILAVMKHMPKRL